MLGFQWGRVKHPSTLTPCPFLLLGYVMGFSGICSTSLFGVSDVELSLPINTNRGYFCADVNEYFELFL